MLENALAAFEGQVQTVEFGVMLLELVDHAQRLQVVFEAAEIAHALVQGVLPGVAERRMPEIMGEADGLGQFLVQLHRAGDGARYLRDLQRMRQPRSVQIALVIDEHLGLVDQPAKRGGMHDAIAVALIFRADAGLGSGWRRPRECSSRRIRREARSWRHRHSKYSVSVASSAALGVLVGDDGAAELFEQHQAHGAGQHLLVHLHHS